MGELPIPFSTHKAQVLAKKKADELLWVNARKSNGSDWKKKVEFDFDIKGSGFRYSLSPAGDLMRQKVDRVRAVFRLNESRGKGDPLYILVTMFPVP